MITKRKFTVKQVFFHYQVGSLVDHRGSKPYTLVGPPVLRLVLDPLAVLLLNNRLSMITHLWMFLFLSGSFYTYQKVFLFQGMYHLTVAHSKQGMGVEVFLRQCEQWLTRKIGSKTAAYGSSRRMTSPKIKQDWLRPVSTGFNKFQQAKLSVKIQGLCESS